MPTGYTANLYDGKPETFREFALHCARNFGALVMMRDEPWDAIIPEEFQPSTYHTEAMEKAIAEHAEKLFWAEHQWIALATQMYEKDIQYRADQKNRNNEIRHRYEDMLSKARDWEAPSPDHEGLKQFMISQLQESIEFDTRYTPRFAVHYEWENLREEILTGLDRDINYHRDEQAKEEARTENRNKWIRELRRSLPYE